MGRRLGADRSNRFRRNLTVTAALAGAALRSELQYRANFLMISAGLIYQGTGFAFIWVVLANFNVIAGWTVAEVAFLYGMRLTAHGLWAAPFNRLLDIDTIVREGEFDRYLVRPLNPLLQILTSRIWLGSFGDIVGGLVIFGVAASRVDIDWSPAAAAYLVLAVVGGALIESSVQLIMAALTFRTLSTLSLRLTIDSVFNTFGNYPLRIFGDLGQFLLTFVLPLAFVAYLPASLLLGRSGELAVPPALAYLTLPIGALWFTAAYAFWRRQTTHYQSSGH